MIDQDDEYTRRQVLAEFMRRDADETYRSQRFWGWMLRMGALAILAGACWALVKAVT